MSRHVSISEQSARVAASTLKGSHPASEAGRALAEFERALAPRPKRPRKVEPHKDGPQAGMVVDYAAIAIVWDPIHALLDHRCLNDIPGLENPTTEVLAPFILEIFATALPETVAVRVYESSTTWCEARR